MISTAIALQNLKNDDIAWKLLRAKRAPMVIAILDAHFTGNVARIPVPEFINLVENDLEELQFRTSIEVSKSAQAYCEKWRAAGYLIRRPMAQSRQETYELSGGALVAISYAKRLMQPHRTATQSRLAIIIDQISNLALATDDNEEHRREALLEERSRIDAQLARLDQGEIEVLDRAAAIEKTKDIVSLAREIPADFIHVRNDFEQLNRSLYETIINYEPDHQNVLADIFDGVDEIAQSASGQSFKGFYSLLRDSELTETLQDDIDTLLECDFADELSADERRFLRGLMQVFVDRSQEVNGVMTSFAHGLRRFVQSQNYQQERILKQQLDRALGRAHRVVEAYPCTQRMDESLNLTSVQIMPVSRWKLKNPAETQAAPAQYLSTTETESISLEQLLEIARQTEIDFAELAHNVNDCFKNHPPALSGTSFGRAGISIAEVLHHHPATQGIASIVGLVELAIDQGIAQEGEELLYWKSDEGKRYRARIPKLAFTGEVSA
ncbi:MAG: DUF3375 domain-containing protein [Raoultibacter sp.]